MDNFNILESLLKRIDDLNYQIRANADRKEVIVKGKQIKDLLDDSIKILKLIKADENKIELACEYPIKYIGETCTNCGRVRVEKWSNGDRICEKCNWNLDKEEYYEDR